MNSPQPEQRADVGEIARRHAPILDQVHDAVVVTDLDGVIHGWNRAAERIYGWSVSEAIGRHVELLYFDEDLHQVIDDVLGPLQLAGSHEIVLRSRHKTGREIFIELRLSLLRDEADRPIGAIGCSNEITEQKQMVEALRLARKSAEESLSLLTTLYRTAPVGLAFVDCDLRYVRVNEALAEINGVPAAEHIGRLVAELVPKLFPALEPVYRRVIETRTPVVDLEVRGETSARPGEFRHWRANYYPVEAADGTMLGVGVVVVEITEAESAREELRREHDLSEKLIQLAQSIVLVLDAEGRIVRYNPFMEKLTGVRLNEARGKDWFRTFLPERDRERIRKLFHQVLDGVESQGITNPIATQDDSERQISWWNTTLADAAGNVQGVLCIGHDITDLLEAQERTLRSQRLATIGETIAMIAHESRSELDALGLGFQLLSETPANDPDQARWIEMLQRSHRRLQHLFDDLREFAAPFHPDRALCDLPTLWRAAWESLTPKRNGRDAVLAEQVQGDARCEVDALRIEQAFRNLFENSLEACPDPMRIDVRCAEAEQEGRRVVHVFVRDNGPGVRGEDREKLFDPFFTTRQKGSGLGLAIVRRIVEAHGGSIAARDPGQCGAEFVLTLPREAGDPPER